MQHWVRVYWSRKETDTAKPHDLKKEEGRTKTNRLEFLKNDRDQLKNLWCWMEGGGRRMWIMGWWSFWILNKAQMCSSANQFKGIKPPCCLSEGTNQRLEAVVHPNSAPSVSTPQPSALRQSCSYQAQSTAGTALRIQSTSHCAFLCNWWKLQSIIMISFDFAVGQQETRRVWWFLGSNS